MCLSTTGNQESTVTGVKLTPLQTPQTNYCIKRYTDLFQQRTAFLQTINDYRTLHLSLISGIKHLSLPPLPATLKVQLTRLNFYSNVLKLISLFNQAS